MAKRTLTPRANSRVKKWKTLVGKPNEEFYIKLFEATAVGSAVFGNQWIFAGTVAAGSVAWAFRRSFRKNAQRFVSSVSSNYPATPPQPPMVLKNQNYVLVLGGKEAKALALHLKAELDRMYAEGTIPERLGVAVTEAAVEADGDTLELQQVKQLLAAITKGGVYAGRRPLATVVADGMNGVSIPDEVVMVEYLKDLKRNLRAVLNLSTKREGGTHFPSVRSDQTLVLLPSRFRRDAILSKTSRREDRVFMPSLRYYEGNAASVRELEVDVVVGHNKRPNNSEVTLLDRDGAVVIPGSATIERRRDSSHQLSRKLRDVVVFSQEAGFSTSEDDDRVLGSYVARVLEPGIVESLAKPEFSTSRAKTLSQTISDIGDSPVVRALDELRERAAPIVTAATRRLAAETVGLAQRYLSPPANRPGTRPSTGGA